MRVDVPDHNTFIDFPDGTPPAEMQAVLAKSFPSKAETPKPTVFDNMVKGPAARLAQGVNSAAGSMLDSFGLKEGAKAYKEGADYWARKADAAGSSGIPAKIYEGIGSAPQGVAEFVAGVPYAAIKGGVRGYQEDGVKGAVKDALIEGTKRLAIGKVFKGIENANLTPLQKSGTMAGTMGAQTAAEGGSLQDVVAATATGAALMPPTGGGRQGVVRQRMLKAGAAPEVAADLSARLPETLPKVELQNTEWEQFPNQPKPTEVRSPEALPARTELDAVQPKPVDATVWDNKFEAVKPETPSPVVDSEVARPEHSNLEKAAVTGADSLELQKAAPEIKPVVKMTVQEAKGLKSNGQIEAGKVIHTDGKGNAYIIDSNTVQGIYGGSKAESVKRAKIDLKDPAKESELLGYPKNTDANGELLPKSETVDVAVTKQGDVVTDLPTMKTEAENGNVAYAAEGTPETAIPKAQEVAKVVKQQGVRNLLTDIQKAGGIKLDSLIRGIDKNEVKGPKGGNRYLKVTGKNGVGLDQMAQSMADKGWNVPRDLEGNVDVQKFTDMLRREVNGEKSVHPDDVNRMVEKYQELAPEESEHVLRTVDLEADRFDGKVSKEAANEALAEFDRLFGTSELETPTGKTADVSTGYEGTPKAEPRTERIDQSGWEQQVAVEGQSKPQTIGQVQKQGGRAVGTSELMDGFTPDPQVTLFHAGIPSPIEWAKDFYNKHLRKLETGNNGTAAAPYKDFQDKNRVANQDTMTLAKAKELAMRAIIDESGNTRMALNKAGVLGDAARRAFDRMKGSGGKAMAAAEKNDAITKGMTLRDRQALGDYVALNRELEIAASRAKTGEPYIHAGGLTLAQLAQAKADFAAEYRLTPESMQRIEQATKDISDAHRANVDLMEQAGLVTPEQAVALKEYDYSPKQFLQHIDPDVKASNRNVSITESGIERLKGGSDQYYRNNPMELLNEATARVLARIDKNNANLALRDLAADPNNGIVKLPTSDKPPQGWTSFSYMENGKAKDIWMKDEFAKEWHQGDPLLNQQFVKIMQIGSGAALVRAQATGYNPAFIFTNIPRDIMTIWLQSEKGGYSPLAPKALAEMAMDMKAVWKNAWTKTGRYEAYTNEGGNRERLTHEGMVLNKRSYASPAIRHAQNVLSYVNNFSEVLTRLAYRERLIKNGVDPQKATDLAAEYVDFARGGNVIRAIDQIGLPYLNAAMQATRSIGRAAYKDPVKFSAKLAQVAVASATIYGYNQVVNPEGWAQVSDRDKEANFIIMLPPWMSYQDKNGDTRYPYLKIQKEQSMRPLTTLVEGGFQKYNEGKEVSKQAWMAIKDAIPNPIQLPPVGKALYSYLTNTDFYTEDRVWKGKQDIEPFAEYRNTTPEAFVKVGKAFAGTDEEGNPTGGLSPDRLKKSVEGLILPTNAYVQTAAGMAQAAWDKLSGAEKTDMQKTNYEKLRSIPGISRIFGAANAMQGYQEDITESRRSANTAQFEVNKQVDKLVSEYVKPGGNTQERYDELSKIVNALPESEQERINKRINQKVMEASLPDKKWWQNVKSLTPEKRAEQFYKRYQKETPEKQQEMIEIADSINGFSSERFINRYQQLQGEQK